jgi:excinuclease ABC subunit C
MQPMNHPLVKFLANLTSEPGIYRMLDKENQVLYVGKATNLKKRVNSYFNKTDNGIKTRSLVSQIAAIEITVTRSETEALLLESNLIKSLKPKYNILMRDDKSYPFIHISSEQEFPRIELKRCKKKPLSGSFFGPYPSVTAARETMAMIEKVFKIRTCSDHFFSGRTRPCLQYQINRCTAPCTRYISRDAYRQLIIDVERFLQGKCQQILAELETRMNKAVNNLVFEEAASLRDQIKNLRLVQEQQVVTQLRGDADIIAIEARPGFACVQYVTVREGEIIASQRFFPKVPEQTIEEDAASLWQQVFTAFINFYYLDMPERIPALIVTEQAVEEQAVLQTLLSKLRGRSCHIHIRPRGVKAGWLDFARNNLRTAVAEHMTSSNLMSARYQALQALLHLTKPIHRMECFDISHTQGSATVASCVVFDANGPNKQEYRRFNIKGITPGDDYAAMQQAITRRFKHLMREQRLPDILIIDGGKGQVAVAKRVFDDLGVHEVTLLGIAKGTTRKAGWERLILVNAAQEITLPMEHPALHLLQQIRDEAHRFAITAHRKKRQKISLQSTLETIESIGVKRRQALLQRFGGIRDLSKASIEEIAKVPGISHALATRIYQHFHL